jgi:hypothetical protein
LSLVRIKAINASYRRAILQAIESLHDFHSRSSIDAIRRHTQQSILEDHAFEDHSWNDTLFFKTFKSIVENGEVDLCANVAAELSASCKRKRADSLLRRLQSEEEKLVASPKIPEPLPDNYHRLASSPVKHAPHRKPEHDKWKIISKKEYDKSNVENPMDTQNN